MTGGGLGSIGLTLSVLVAAGLVAAALNGAVRARSVGSPIAAAVLAPAVELARLFRQRRRSTLAADRLLWRAATVGFVVAPLLMMSVVPLGTAPVLGTPIGIVWLNAADVLLWAIVWLLGWGPNSVFGLVGAYRFLASALAYELPLMFALIAPAVAAGSLAVGDVVASQTGLWNLARMPVAFLVVCAGVVGFSVWGPLSAAAGRDLAGGVLAELSGPDRLIVEAGRYLMLVAGSAFAGALFLGGTNGPFLPGWAWMAVKTLALLAAFVALRRRMCLLRPDRFLELGWMVLLPAALLQVLVTAVVTVTSKS